MSSSRYLFLLCLCSLLFLTGCRAAKPAIRCKGITKGPCLYEEADTIELICSHSNPIVVSDVTFLINNMTSVIMTSVKQMSRFEVGASLVAQTTYNTASCSVGEETSQRASLHVLGQPTKPEVGSCLRVKVNERRESEDSFQCTWKPSIPARNVVHQLLWSRKYLNGEESPREWKVCPHQVDGTCTWFNSGNSSYFFSDEDGSTEGWENCVVVVAHNRIESEGLDMKNHTSEPYCFGMTEEQASGLSAGAVAGITLGVVFTVLLIVGVVLFYRKQKKMKSLKIEIPEGLDIQMEDANAQDSHYYATDNEAPEATWRDSWISSVATPSTGNSTAPLLNSDPHHFTFSNAHGKNYVKSKLPNDKARLDKVQTKDQTDLINRLLANNNDETTTARAGITYAVIKNPEVNKKLDTISENKNSYQSSGDGNRVTEPQVSIGDDEQKMLRDEEDEEHSADGMYTIDIPWSVGSNPTPGPVHSPQSGNSVTSYTVIAPSPDRTPRNLSIAVKCSEEV